MFNLANKISMCIEVQQIRDQLNSWNHAILSSCHLDKPFLSLASCNLIGWLYTISKNKGTLVLLSVQQEMYQDEKMNTGHLLKFAKLLTSKLWKMFVCSMWIRERLDRIRQSRTVCEINGIYYFWWSVHKFTNIFMLVCVFCLFCVIVAEWYISLKINS